MIGSGDAGEVAGIPDAMREIGRGREQARRVRRAPDADDMGLAFDLAVRRGLRDRAFPWAPCRGPP